MQQMEIFKNCEKKVVSASDTGWYGEQKKKNKEKKHTSN